VSAPRARRRGAPAALDQFDPNKDAENIARHGVSLTEGDGVLSDPLCLTV
jgi:hypothetical protein